VGWRLSSLGRSEGLGFVRTSDLRRTILASAMFLSSSSDDGLWGFCQHWRHTSSFVQSLFLWTGSQQRKQSPCISTALLLACYVAFRTSTRRFQSVFFEGGRRLLLPHQPILDPAASLSWRCTPASKRGAATLLPGDVEGAPCPEDTNSELTACCQRCRRQRT
jgi:hypothetical protein